MLNLSRFQLNKDDAKPAGGAVKPPNHDVRHSVLEDAMPNVTVLRKA